MRIVVMGAGAIGSLYGGMLSLRTKASVTLVGRRSLAESVKAHGLIIEGVLGSHRVMVDVVESAEEIENADVVLITTKAYDTLTAAKDVSHLAKQGAYIVLLQNGLGTELAVSRNLNTTRVIRATTCMGALMESPGRLTVTGCGLTEMGSRYPENMKMVKLIADIFQDAGLDTRVSDNIEGVVWTKTIVNCGINPIGALTGLRNGEIHQNPALRQLVIQLVKETVSVSDALGVQLTTDDPIRYTLGTAKATSENINSMLRDIQLRKPTEIDSITGTVIRLAKELGIRVPLSEAVYALVKAVESKFIDDSARYEDAIFSVEDLLDVIHQH